jgi:hypothetical protein
VPEDWMIALGYEKAAIAALALLVDDNRFPP